MKAGRVLRSLILAVMGLMAGAWAQDYSQGPNGEAAPRSEGPPPDVARISLIHGDVSTQRGDTGEWAATSINAPLVRGDQVATGDKARTELQLDYANILRLAGKSQIKIADLTRTRVQIQVAQGYASYTQFKGSEVDAEIDTPNVAVRLLKNGRYRVQVTPDAETDVIVREGEAEITTPQGSTRVREGEMIIVRGTDDPEYKVSSAPVKDDWDRWNSDRDHVIRDAQSWGRTNRYYTGAQDLDAYGRWVYVPGYGNVWQPYQEAEWAPYQTGRWVWEPYYGWTWVSYEPWGWAPYHYGRWFFYSGNWCWWPGPVYASYRPLWSPAFVFFVGFGHHSGVGFGSIGWLPVGPHDAFYPWYGRGFNRVTVVNVTNINVTNVNVVNVNRGGGFIAPLAVRGRQPYYSNVNMALTNARVRGSITAVSTEDFGRGNFAHGRHGVDLNEWRDARVMTAQVPVVPTRESLHAGSGSAGVPSGIQPRSTDHFFTRHQPPAGPESFHDQAARVQRVVRPEAAGGTSAGAQGNVHTGAGQMDRRGMGGASTGAKLSTGVNARGNLNERTGNAEVSRQDTTGKAAGGGNAAQQNTRENRGGWTKFGPPAGHTNGGVGETPTPMSRSHDSGRIQRTDTMPDSRRGNGSNSGNDSPNWQKFPSAGARESNDRPPSAQSGRGITPSDSPMPSSRTQDGQSGGWQRFPSNADRGVQGPQSSGDRPGIGSKPPLELHRPIVTPRDTYPGSEPRYSPSPRSEPRYSPPPQSESPRYSPPPRSESPRYSPPSRSESRGNSSSSHGGSGDRGGHSDSRSSSNPKQR